MNIESFNIIEKSSKKALYIGIPYCKNICSYCHYKKNLNFGYSFVPNKYFETLCDQLEQILKNLNSRNFESIYFGGGTPSLLNDKQLERIFSIINNYDVTSREYSIELHPNYINFNLENNYFTRYSIGVQTFIDEKLEKYNRKGYSLGKLKELCKTVKLKNINTVINLDIIFDEELDEIEFAALLKINPESIILYPNTKYRSENKIENIEKTLIKAKKRLIGYNNLYHSKFIFIKKDYKESYYSRNEYNILGDIIGIGHNSLSHIGNESYLSRYENNNIIYELKDTSRYLTYLIAGISTGIKKEYLNLFDFNIENFICFDKEICYLPRYDYISFYKQLEKLYSKKLLRTFRAVIGYGDPDINLYKSYYNTKLDFEVSSRLKKYNLVKYSNEILEIPKKIILIEGIDGSGKDTFAHCLVKELKRRFKYSDDKTISVIGQPSSRLKSGKISKKFIEDADLFFTSTTIENFLRENRIESEKEIASLNGMVIIVRGIVTDIATINRVFGVLPKSDLGLGTTLKKIDSYIVVDVDPKKADTRIEKRGIPRTWREHIEHLTYFREFYKEYNNKIFIKKEVINNDNDIEFLEEKAKKIADSIYIQALMEESDE